MKLALIIAAAALAGILVGVGFSWADFGHAPPEMFPQGVQGPKLAGGSQLPKVSVDHGEFDFGFIERDVKVSHTFKITNAGEGPLTLKDGGTTCTACTIAALSKHELEPGETAEITVEYMPDIQKTIFRQVATVLTNDQKQPRVEFQISGRVTSKYRLLPNDVVFSNVAANATATAELRIFGFVDPQVRLAGYEFTGSETADLFAVSSEALPADQLTEPGAKAGCKLRVTLKPGLPLGPIRQTIRLTIDSGEGTATTPMVVPIQGSIVSDISIIGSKFQAEFGLLSIGIVKSAEGTTRKLTVLVRGEHRQAVRFDAQKVVPSWLKVSIGEPEELNAAVTQFPLTI